MFWFQIKSGSLHWNSANMVDGKPISGDRPFMMKWKLSKDKSILLQMDFNEDGNILPIDDGDSSPRFGKKCVPYKTD